MHADPTPRPLPHRTLAAGLLLATALAGCSEDVLLIPQAHMTPTHTPASWQFAAEPQAVWSAVLAEMAAEPGQRSLARSDADLVGSWCGELKKIKKWDELACEGTKISGWSSSGQMLTTAWVDAAPDGSGSRLHLVRVFMCDNLYENVSPSRGDYERGLAQRISTRLGEQVVAGSTGPKAGQP